MSVCEREGGRRELERGEVEGGKRAVVYTSVYIICLHDGI